MQFGKCYSPGGVRWSWFVGQFGGMISNRNTP